jgi:hypothetical protein
MKHLFHLLFVVLMLSCTHSVYSQTKDSTIAIKDESDTIIDYTRWTNKGFIGVIPIHMQPGFNGLLNYGVGLHFAFALPSWVTFRGKAIIDLYEENRALWSTKGYENSEKVQRGYWFEAGLDVNFLDILKTPSKTYIAKIGKFVERTSIERQSHNGTVSDNPTTYTQEIYGKYYDRSVYMHRLALRLGAAQYQFTYADDPLYIVNNVSVQAIYGGLSYSKIGLGKPFLLTVFADALYKSKLTTSPDQSHLYLSKSVNGQIGYRAGLIIGNNNLGGVVEIGMAPGLDDLEFYVKAGVTLNFNLLSAQKLIRKKIEPEIDNSNQTQE